MSLPNIQSLVSIHAKRVQALEDAAYALILGRSAQAAEGATLDLVGEMVGQLRSTSGPDSTDDAAYRALIFGRIILNNSNGDPESVLALLKLIGATSVYYRPAYPAGILVDFGGEDLLLDDSSIRELIEQATPPISIGLAAYSGVAGFGFASDPDALGFGEGALARTVI